MMCIGAMLYEGITKVVYAATLKDSDAYYNPELLIDSDKLLSYGYNKIEIEIVKCLHEDKAVEVLKKHVDRANNRVLITGAVMASDNDLIVAYKKIVDLIDKSKWQVSSPLDTMKFVGNDQERYVRAMNLLKDTKCIIAEMSVVSVGQGMELQEAVNLNIPILVIAKVGSKISSLVKGCKNVVEVIYYAEIDDVMTKIREFIEKYG